MQEHEDINDLAIAHLTLAIGKSNSQPTGPEPDEAELAALVENKLDDVRRAQVISHIAANTMIYDRWIQLVDALAYVGEIDVETTHDDVSVTDRKSIVDKIKDILSPKTMGMFGGGVATAAIALFVIFALPLKDIVNIPQGLDDAYIGWGTTLENDWARTPDANKPTPIFSGTRKFTFKPLVKSDVRKVVESGFKDGSNKIATYPFSAFSIDPASLSSISVDELKNLSADDYSLLYNTGRLAVLTSMQCIMDPNSDRLISLHTIATSLVENLEKTAVAELKPLTEDFGATNNPADAVCRLSVNIMDYLVSRPNSKASDK